MRIANPWLAALLRQIADRLDPNPQTAWSIDMSRIYKADTPDFEGEIKLKTLDSEGNPVADASLPEGVTVQYVSSDEGAFSVVAGDQPTKFIAHVGSPGEGGTPRSCNFTVNIVNPDGSLRATASETIIVVPGDAASIQVAEIVLPESNATAPETPAE